MMWQLWWVSELSKLGSRTWGGIPGGSDGGSSDSCGNGARAPEWLAVLL